MYIVSETRTRNNWSKIDGKLVKEEKTETSYFAHIVDLGPLGTSPCMTQKREEAKKFEAEAEAARYAKAISSRAIVETI
jgi:hypothetical protein